MVEVPSSSQVSFSYTTNNTIEFVINSPSDMWDAMNSFIRMKLTCALNNNGSDSVNKYISEGGVHSIFSEVRIETVSGVLLQRIDRYNRLYALMSNLNHSQQFVDTMLSRAGDSVGYRAYVPQDENFGSYRALTGTVASAALSGAGVLTMTGNVFSQEVRVGDFIRMEESKTPSNPILEVSAVTDNTSITVRNWTTALVAGEITRLEVLPRRTEVDAIRKRVANTASYTVCMQPLLPLLLQPNWLPLSLIRGGLRIVLTLDNPAYCLASTDPPVSTGFSGASITVSNPYYVCSMVQVDDYVNKQYLDMFRGAGLNYQFSSFAYNLSINNGSSGVYNFQLQPNCRSARTIYTLIQDVRSQTVTSGSANQGQSTYSCDSIAQGLKAGLIKYQFTSGSERFPYAKPVDCTAADDSEIMIVNDEAIGHLGGILWGKRPNPCDLQAVANTLNREDIGASAGKAETRRLALAVSLTRDEGSGLSGLDLSLQPLQAELEFSGTYQVTNMDGSSATTSNRYLSTWIEYDSVVSFSESAIIVRS